jgi:hypothetical protein
LKIPKGGNQHPYIEEEQTAQWPKEKVQKDKQRSTKHTPKTRLTRRVPHVEQELLTIPKHVSSLPVFSGVHVTRSLVLCVCFVDRCLSFFTFSFDLCVVCSSLIYGF